MEHNLIFVLHSSLASKSQHCELQKLGAEFYELEHSKPIFNKK